MRGKYELSLTKLSSASTHSLYSPYSLVNYFNISRLTSGIRLSVEIGNRTGDVTAEMMNDALNMTNRDFERLVNDDQILIRMVLIKFVETTSMELFIRINVL